MSVPAVGSAAPATVRLDTVAERAATECFDLARSIDALQTAMGDLLGKGNIELDASTIRRLQETDRVSQTLDCLARLLSAIAPELETLEANRVDLEAEINLESVANRLLGDG